MKKIAFSKGAVSVIAAILLAALLLLLPAHALEDGAYTVGRTTSYVNPDTGETIDGGTNIALGDSMCASIVEETALVEQSNGKTYVTLDLGLMSNISDVRIQLMDADGNFRDAELTQTGSCERDGDTCNHYRFEMKEDDKYISPILYVTPMGRDVQFFVTLDLDSAQPGTGNFVSEMLSTETEGASGASVTSWVIGGVLLVVVVIGCVWAIGRSKKK